MAKTDRLYHSIGLLDLPAVILNVLIPIKEWGHQSFLSSYNHPDKNIFANKKRQYKNNLKVVLLV